jgi:hypothetical protein
VLLQVYGRKDGPGNILTLNRDLKYKYMQMKIMGNGAVKSENILKLVEASVKNSDSMQQNFDIFDVCKNKNGKLKTAL